MPEHKNPIGSAKIVVRFADGRIVKGYTHDFYPNKPLFHMASSIDDISKEEAIIQIKDLKAVFCVKEFTGDASYNEKKAFCATDQAHGRKIEVQFKDGEILVGTTVGYTPDRLGFFLLPVDAKGNNERVFIVSAAVKKVHFIQ